MPPGLQFQALPHGEEKGGRVKQRCHEQSQGEKEKKAAPRPPPGAALGGNGRIGDGLQNGKA